MSFEIKNSLEYSEITIDNINYCGNFTDKKPRCNLGLDYHTQVYSFSQEKSISEAMIKKDVNDITYCGSMLYSPSVKINPRPVKDSIAVVKKVRDLILSGKIEIEVWNEEFKIYSYRKLTLNDVVISGSFVLTAFYDVTNTSTNKKLVSNDVDIYLMLRTKSLRINNSDVLSFKTFFVNYEEDGQKYQIIRNDLKTETNVYGFYDTDVTRGCIRFINDDSFALVQSKQMIQSLHSGIMIVGFHSTIDRIKKYNERGFGIYVVSGTKLVDPETYYNMAGTGSYTIRGINAVRGCQCRECHLMHTCNKEGLNIFMNFCETCLNKMGVLVIREKHNPEDTSSENYPLTKGHNYYLKYSGNDKDVLSKLIYTTRSLKYSQKCFKARVATIDVNHIIPQDRKTLSKILRIDENALNNGSLSTRFKRYCLRISDSDPLLENFGLIIKQCINSLVYKITFKKVDERYLINLDLYIPYTESNRIQLKSILDIITNVSLSTYKEKNHTPYVTGNKYKKLYENSKAEKLLPKSTLEKSETLIKFNKDYGEQMNLKNTNSAQGMLDASGVFGVFNNEKEPESGLRMKKTDKIKGYNGF